MTLEPETVSALVKTAITAYDQSTARSQQSRAGILGPSDIGYCRMKALLVLSETPPSDSKSMWPAVVGTAVGDWVERAIKAMFPTWIIGSIDGVRVTYSFPKGGGISGTPDIIAPDLNAVLDLKTKDGLAVVRRHGSDLNHRMQRHMYARGAVDAGLLDGDKPVYVGNVYLDRSGADDTPHVTLEPLDAALDDEIQAWVDDVTYARLHNEEASRDLPPTVCEAICEFFTACRGSLPASDNEVYDDEDSLNLLTAYLEGKDLEKRGKALKEQASKELRGRNGIIGGFQVRTTYVNPSDVPAFYREGYDRLDIRPLKGGRR